MKSKAKQSITDLYPGQYIDSHSYLMDFATILKAKMKYRQVEDDIFIQNQPHI